MIIQANEPKKQAAVPILISNKIDFKLNKNDCKGHHIFKGKIQQDDISILYIYAPNTSFSPAFVKETSV